MEIYVALQAVQTSERLSLNQMAVQFAGSVPPESTQNIRRRSSYANAGVSLLSATNHDNIPSISPAGFVRGASFSATPNPPVVTSLRYTTSDATTTTSARHLRADQAWYSQDGSSIGQPGLEAMDTIHEIADWGRHFEIPPPSRLRQNATHMGAPHHPEASENLVRDCSIRTDTAGRARRLAGLIQDRCLHISIEPDIESSEPRPSEISIVDRKTVRDILSRKRRENPTFKDPSSGLFKSKKAKQKASDVDTWTFDECDKSLALREAVEESGHVGVARELIDMGADVSFLKQASKPKLKGFRSDRFEVVPCNFAKIAATRNRVEMVSLLAARGASPANLVEALEQAVRHNLPNVVATLLRNGTDPNARDGSIITSAVASQDPALVRLLLRAHKKIDKRWLISNLPTAVLQGQTEIVFLLVTYGADTDFECASALRKAVQAQRIDLVLAVLKRNANSQTASSVFDVAFSSHSSLTVPEQYLLIEILLCAGAKGDNAAKMLTPVVQAGHRSICKLLIMHGADPQFNKGEALKIAVKAANVEILSVPVLGNITTKAASSMIDEVPYKCNDDLKCKLMTLLITKGAKGISLHRALVHAVQQKDKKTIGLLLNHQASVDFEEAQALRMAVTGGDLAIVNLLLSKGRPQPSLMQLVLPLVPESPPEVRYGMTKSVISVAGQNGIPTDILNNSLLEAAGRPTDYIDNGLIDLLLTAGAKVDYKCGKFFRLAAKHGSTDLLEVLIRTVMEPTSLSAAVPVSMRIKVPSSRRHFIAILLNRGAQGPDVDQAFVDAIEERPMDIFLVQTLL